MKRLMCWDIAGEEKNSSRSSMDYIEESGIHCKYNIQKFTTLLYTKNNQKDKSRKQLHVQLHQKE